MSQSLLWSWRGSNPRPGKAAICFLHAYPGLIVRGEKVTGNRITPYLLLVSPSGRRVRQAIPELRALPYRVGTGHHRPGNVSSQHLVPGLSLAYLIRSGSKSVVILASYHFVTQVIEQRHHPLHAYIPPRLAVKTRSAPDMFM